MVLSRLASRYAVVCIVSGRQAEEIRRLVPVPGVEAFGTYGLTEGAPSPPMANARGEVEQAARRVGGAWVENKQVSLAVHYRAAQNVLAAERILTEVLGSVADRHGLVLMRGKMVVELVPPDTPGKGSMILSEQRERDLRSCLYAGDDAADLQAFGALDELRDQGLLTVKVAVRSAETPPALMSEADVVVDRPAGLVELLSEL
jgi:trehalose 6-phosphate phosphatase